MKGILKKTEQGWVVKHLGYVPPHEYELPLHPANQLKLLDDRDGEEVEFEPIEDYRYKVNGFGLTYAKLIKPNVPTQNDDVREDDVEKIMNLSEQSRNAINEVALLCSGEVEEHIFDMGFYEGYNKAKENTYTKEQLIKAISMAKGEDGNENYDVFQYTTHEIIQSLK